MIKFIITYIFVLLSISSIAQTVVWSTPPTYKVLEEYGELYKIKENGKVGLADKTGKLILTAAYDSITPFYNHYALVLNYDNGKYLLSGILNEYNYTLTSVNGNYYISEEYPFFSEDYLVIHDTKELYGYLKIDGSIFIECKYLDAHPFYYGIACVQEQKGRLQYIKEDGTYINIKDKNGISYSFLSVKRFIPDPSMNERGEAIVLVRNAKGSRKAYVLKSSGVLLDDCVKFTGNQIKAKKGYSINYRPSFSFPASIKKTTTLSSNTPLPFVKDKLWGIKQNGNIILPEQFQYIAPFRDGYALVKSNDKYGVLKLESGEFHLQMDKDIVRVRNNKGEKVSYTMSVPSAYIDKKINLNIIDNNEIIQQTVWNVKLEDKNNDEFIPLFYENEKEKIYHFELYSDNILLWKGERKVTAKRPSTVPLILTNPQVTESFKFDEDGFVRADSNNKVEVYSILKNTSNEQMYIEISWFIDDKETEKRKISVAPNSSSIVVYSIEVRERRSIEVQIKTSSGLVKRNIIKVKNFV